MAGRYLYLPSIGFALGAGCLVASAKWRRLGLGLVVTIVIVNVFGSFVTLAFLRKTGQTRHQLVSQVVTLARSGGRDSLIVISGLPDKYRDVAEAARHYGANVKMDTRVANCTPSRYVDGTLVIDK